MTSDGIPKLRRVLLAYTVHNQDVGYCQVGEGLIPKIWEKVAVSWRLPNTDVEKCSAVHFQL